MNSLSIETIHISVINATRVDFDQKINWSILGFNTTNNLRIYYDEIGTDPTEDDIIDRCQNCHVMISKEIPITESIIKRLPTTIQLICEAGTGYNNINLQACKERNIHVTNVPKYSEKAVASLVLTFLLNFSCDLITQQKELWNNNRISFYHSIPSLNHFELEGKVLGLIGGNGTIGKEVMKIAITLGMKILISTRDQSLITTTTTKHHDSNNKSNNGNNNNSIITSIENQQDLVEYTDSIEYLLRNSDFISIHCPLNQETKHLINKETIEYMKPSAYLINTARGDIIHEDDLIEALVNKRIAGAALDVQSIEPPVSHSLLYTLPNVIITPHIGWKRIETRQRVIQEVLLNIIHYINQTPIHIVSNK